MDSIDQDDAHYIIGIEMCECSDDKSTKRMSSDDVGRVNASLGFRSFDGAQKTVQGYEAMNMIRKGQVRWLAKGDITEQVRFIEGTFGLAA